ncbi:hypothetical protein M2189_006459 [Bradyrhizobium japonicum]|nr:hypothetical protein [Bradyrhizobium japonicum]MCS3963256.1 hypothetical protein [Bradyrhizobium japonicum]MCS3995569.1 hypothetical protein [Bradyrhizobium japonicum]
MRNFPVGSMLYCSNSKGRLMEPEHREDNTTPDRAETERPTSGADQAPLTAPFASEGLERVRDSHC